MKHATGSKSALTKKTPKTAKTLAQGGSPEVTLANGTAAGRANPADAPPPPKAGRKRKPEPSVAIKAALPEAASAVEPAPEAPTPKPKPARAPKAAKPAPVAAGTATPGSLRAIGNAWIESIRAAGHSKSTVSSYAADLEVAYEALDGNAPAGGFTEKQVATFNVSKGVMKKANGKPKAQPTILKTRRALRLALVWAAQTNLIAKAPYTAA